MKQLYFFTILISSTFSTFAQQSEEKVLFYKKQGQCIGLAGLALA
jgi:hypothetical protein